jgi:hypothetical protein
MNSEGGDDCQRRQQEESLWRWEDGPAPWVSHTLRER